MATWCSLVTSARTVSGEQWGKSQFGVDLKIGDSNFFPSAVEREGSQGVEGIFA